MEPYSANKGKDGSAEPTRDENEISVLCFNVFAGSPLPFYHCGGTALQDSERLRLQVEHIRKVQPDIIALQEVCSDSVARAYREAFKDIYDSYYDFLSPSITAVGSLILLYTILASILSLAFHSVLVHVLGFWQPPVSTEQLTGGIMLFSAVFLKCLVLVAIVMRRSAVTGFLSGSVKGSNMVLWKRSRFSVAYEKKHGGALVPCDMYTTLFKEQQGDYLNWFRPRGYLSVRLFFNGTVPLWVVNVHLNLGTKDFRRRQVDELRTHCEALSPTGSVLLVGDMNATPDSEEICLLTQEGGFRDALSEHGCGMQPTWAARNPLTQGVLIEDDHRCDYIFYRPMVGCHEVENRSCRIVMDSQPWLSDHFGLLMDLSLKSLAPSQNVPVELPESLTTSSGTLRAEQGAEGAMEACSPLPGEEEDDIQQHLEREGREARILFSWRVPNEPAHEGPSRTGGAEGGCLSARGRGAHPTSLPLCSEPSPPPTKSKHNARRPQGLGVSKVPGSVVKDESQFPSSLQSPTGKDEKNRIRKTFWSYLFRNVNRAVDELYYLCEAEASTEHCEEAAKLLDSCSRDFYKLIERIEVQAKFEEDQKRCGDDDDASNLHRAPRGLGWEVRKTTGSTAPEQSVIIREAIERMSGVQASRRRPSTEDIPSAHVKRTEYLQQGNESAGEGKGTSRRKDKREQLGRGRRRSSRAQDSSKSEAIETLEDHQPEQHTADDDDGDILSILGSPKKLTFDDDAHNEEGAGNVEGGPLLDVDAEEAHEAVLHEGPEAADGTDVLDGARLTLHDENEEATDIEVAEATEEVWAEAEAWVDAEAKAEDEAWARLQRHGDKLVVVVDESNSDEVDVILEDSFDGSRQPSGTDDASFFFENDHDADGEEPWLLSGAEGDLPVGDSPKSSFSSPLCSPRSSGQAQAGAGCATALDFALSRRYLRDKLSSPERKKPTPAEAKRKLDEKQLVADMKRVLMELERQKKLKLAAERMRGVNERRTRKTALAEKLYEAKLGQAEQRQKAHIQAIARKAEDESTKVKEISFINHLTSEVLRTTITERLTDVENRIQAGRARRQQHLHGIANRQKKKREKARQMSERRLEMEQLAAQRWDALQARLEAVQERRHQRLVEIQRRLESNSESRQQRQLRRDRDPSMREKENVPDVNRSSSDHRHTQHRGRGDPTWSSQAKPSRHPHRKAGKKKASASGPQKAGKQQKKADEPLDVTAAVDTSTTGPTAQPLLGLPASAQKIREHLCRGVPGWKPPGQHEQRQQQCTEFQMRKLKSILVELKADMGELSPQVLDGVAPGETDTRDNNVYESDDEDGRRTERLPGALSCEGAVAKKRRRRRSKCATPPAVEPTAMLPPGPILQALRALTQVVETKNEALLSELGPAGALRLLCRLAKPGAYPPSVACQALHVVHICMQSADVRNGVLADCGGASMVDAALWSMCHLQATQAKDLQATTSYSAALSSLCMIIRHVPSDEALRRLHEELVGYAVEAGVVQYASQVLDMVRGTLSGEEKDRARRGECMKITGKTLLLLEALSAAALAVSPSTDHGHQDAMAALRAKVVAAFKETQLASQLPTLSALLMNERPHGGYDVEDVTEGVLSAAWLVLRCLNDLARIDLRTMQSLLRSEELQSYFHYVYSMLLRVLTAKLSKASLKDVEASLEQLLTLIGFYFLDCPETQQTLQASPVLLSRLANLPFRYFCDEQYKEVLFPTLLTACYRCCPNKALLKNEMNTELLVAYLERKIEEREASLASGKEGGQSASGWAALSVRFPERFWQDAARYFQES